jgi:hypothetical protein
MLEWKPKLVLLILGLLIVSMLVGLVGLVHVGPLALDPTHVSWD